MRPDRIDVPSRFDPSDGMLGGYSPLDGTVEFYGRINAALRRDSVVLDLGAGRGAWFYEDQCGYHRELRGIRGSVAEYIGADVHRAILANLERVPSIGELSYLYGAEPQYHFGSRTAFLFFSVLHRFAPKAFVGNVFVFVRKPSAPASMD